MMVLPIWCGLDRRRAIAQHEVAALAQRLLHILQRNLLPELDRLAEDPISGLAHSSSCGPVRCAAARR
jgi:hypothetical protein